jgi:hypothetical protein
MGMTCSSSAQQFFNKRDALHSFFSTIAAVTPMDGSYYTSSYAWDSINYIGNGLAWGAKGINFAKFDNQGHKVFDTIYQKGGWDISPLFGEMISMPDKTFLLAADEGDTSGNRYLSIIRFDTSGNVVFEKEFPKPVCTGIANDFWRVVDLKPDSFGNWLLLSTIKCDPTGNDDQHDFFLMKLDSAFSLIWEKQYGSPTLNDLAGELLIEPDGYVLAGGRDNSNKVSMNFKYNAELIKTDTSGTVEWQWLSSNQKKTSLIRDVLHTQDGGYIYCGQGDGYEIMGANGQYSIPVFRAWVEKLDVNRNIVWSKSFGNYYYNTELRKIIEATDGRFFLFGYKYLPDSLGINNWMVHTRGWFLTLGANGDSLRERTYYKMSTCLDRNIIYDAEQTDDGGFIMVGEATDQCVGFTEPSQRGWIVKVDSNGCLGPGDPQCWPTAIAEIQPTASKTKIYPNPVQEQLTVSYSNKTDNGSLFQVTDVTGRKILEENLEGASGHKLIDVRKLQPGVYLYKIMENGAISLQGKFVKQ